MRRRFWTTLFLAILYHLLPAQTNVWNSKTPMPSPGKARFLSAGFAIGTKLYFCTGMDDSFQALPDFWEYNTTNDTWTQKTDFPGGARYGATGFAINGKGYITLGTNGTSALDDLWEFDPAGNAGAGSWTQKQNYGGSGRAGAFVFVVDNKAYVGTGQDVNSVLLSDMWMYDPTNNTWTSKQSVPGVSRMYAAAFAIGSKGYMGTGIDSNDDGLATFFEYDPGNNQWTAKAPYGGGAMQSAVGFALNNRGYIGRGGTGAFWQYNPHLNTWTQKSNVSLDALLNAVGMSLGTKGYYFSGYGVSLSAALQEYTPDPTLTDQTITFNALADKTVGAANFNLTATASSGLTVAYASSNTSVATVSGNTVTIVGVGTTTITATQVGNATYDPAPPVERVLTVAKASQTITFNALPAKTNTDAPFTLSATSTSGLAVAFTSSNTSVATIAGTTVTILSAGTTIITASQPGNEQYQAAALVDQTLTVSKGTPVWTGALPTAAGYNNDFEVALSLSNSLTYTLTSANTAIATVAQQGNKWVISPKALGSVEITATRAADANFNAAPTLTATLVVGKGTQTITVGDIPVTTVNGGTFVLSGTSTSGQPVRFSVPLTASIVIYDDVVVSALGGGTTVVTAQADGSDLFLPVTSTFNLTLTKAHNVIKFDPLKERALGDLPFALQAEAMGFSLITYTSSNPSVATISGNQVNVNGVGTTTITALTTGDSYYDAATPVSQLLTVRQPHTVSFAALPPKTLGDPAFSLSATSSAGLPIVFTSADTAVAKVNGTTVTIKRAGSTLITATSGNDTYAKREVSRLLVVKNVVQTAAEQGQLWGQLSLGGAYRAGSIFMTNADGSGYTVVKEFKEFVTKRDPKRIGLNMSKDIGGADGLSYTGRKELAEILGKKYEARFVSAEKLYSDFHSRHVPLEISAFAEAGNFSYQLAERALSNEVITPGVTTLEDVAWWLKEQLFKNNLESSFGMPSVYVTGPKGIEATSTNRIIQRGDILMLDWGVGIHNLYTDMKRIAYVAKEGEKEVPKSIQNAFDQAVKVRDIVKSTIKPHITAQQNETNVYKALQDAGFIKIEFNKPSPGEKTDVIIGCHSVGDWGHGTGPSIAFFNPVQLTYTVKPTNLFSIELFAYTPMPEWGGAKLRIPLEDDAVVTERGVEWLYPINTRIILVK